MTENLFMHSISIIKPSSNLSTFEVATYEKGMPLDNGIPFSLHIYAFNDFFRKNQLDGPIIENSEEAYKMIIQIAYLVDHNYSVFCDLDSSSILALPHQDKIPNALYRKILMDSSALNRFDMVSVGAFSYRGKEDLPEVMPLVDFEPKVEGLAPFEKALTLYMKPHNSIKNVSIA